EIGYTHSWSRFLHDVRDTLVAFEVNEMNAGLFRDVVKDWSGRAAWPSGRKKNRHADERRAGEQQRAIRQHLVDIIGSTRPRAVLTRKTALAAMQRRAASVTLVNHLETACSRTRLRSNVNFLSHGP